MGIPVSANNEKSFIDKAKDFLGQANRMWGVFDGFVPSRASFESGTSQLMGGPCEYNCAGHDAAVRVTADVFEGAGKDVAEVGNRYYPEVAKNIVLSALPVGRGASLADDLLTTPKMIWGKSAQQVADDFTAAGYSVAIRQSTRGSGNAVIVQVKGHPAISQVQVHPGGGRHGGAYYKMSTSTQGIVKVVGSDYRAIAGEKATIHTMGGH